MELLLCLSVNKVIYYKAASDPQEQFQVETVKFHSSKHFSLRLYLLKEQVLKLATWSLEICELPNPGLFSNTLVLMSVSVAMLLLMCFIVSRSTSYFFLIVLISVFHKSPSRDWCCKLASAICTMTCIG